MYNELRKRGTRVTLDSHGRSYLRCVSKAVSTTRPRPEAAACRSVHALMPPELRLAGLIWNQYLVTEVPFYPADLFAQQEHQPRCLGERIAEDPGLADNEWLGAGQHPCEMIRGGHVEC